MLKREKERKERKEKKRKERERWVIFVHVSPSNLFVTTLLLQCSSSIATFHRRLNASLPTSNIIFLQRFHDNMASSTLIFSTCATCFADTGRTIWLLCRVSSH